MCLKARTFIPGWGILPFVVLILLAVITPAAQAQTGFGIDHDPLECIPISNFAAFDAELTPPENVESCRLYFRSNVSPDYYFVEMSVTLESGLYRTYLPKPTSATSSVEYYLECLNTEFANTRTTAHMADVVESADECRRRQPAAAYFVGEDPAIVVGAVNPAAQLAPPAGFSIEGLAVATEGVSRGVVIAGAGAAAAAGITIAALAGDDPSSPASPTGGAALSPMVASPPPPGASVRACFEMNPSDGFVLANGSIGLDASCSSPGDLSYTWDLGDGRMRTGVFVRPTYRVTGTYDVKLKVQSMSDPSRTDETMMALQVATAMADLEVQKTARASCFAGEGAEVTIVVKNHGPSTARNVALHDTVPSGYISVRRPPRCNEISGAIECDLGNMESGASIEIVHALRHGFIFDEDTLRRLEPFPGATVSSDTADPGIGNNQAVYDFGLLTCFDEDLRTEQGQVEIQSRLELASGVANGRLQINGDRSVVVPGGAPAIVRLQAAPGGNRIEARILGAPDSDGTWTLSFARTERFVPGSLRVESGDVVGTGPDTITFRVRRGETPPLRLSFQIGR